MFTDYSFSSTEILIGVAIGFVILLAIIFIGRAYFSRVSESGLTEKHNGKKWSSPLEARNKYPEVDVLRKRGLFMRVGLIGTLTLFVLAFNWTQQEREVFIPDNALALEEEIEIEVPRSAEPPPPPPPPPPPVIEEVPNELVLEAEEDFEFVDQSIEAETAVEAPKFVEETSDVPPPPPPPPPPPEVNVKEIFKIVEEMPRFPGCEDLEASISEKKACADQKMLEFIYRNIKYPQIAKENGIEGTVVVQFVVNTDGSVTDVEVLRDIGGKCGEEGKRIVELMNEQNLKWTPGKQRGRPVRVMFTLPIRFKLEYQ
jgi:protein TonB